MEPLPDEFGFRVALSFKVRLTLLSEAIPLLIMSCVSSFS